MDRFFPDYHFRPKKNWMNDPNGLIWHGGYYHMFYQYNPHADIWGDIHWGHARSRDLLHWEECPIAFGPSAERGELHCYSGCCVEKDGQVYAFYTSIGAGARGPETGALQWAAVSQGELLEWKKQPYPALTQDLNSPYPVRMWRDPFVWSEQGLYFMLLSGSLNNKGCILLYVSEDLEKWKRKSIFYTSPHYPLIECPNILKFQDQYLLLYSPLDAIRYAVGKIDWDNGRFLPEKEGIFDHSVEKKGFYASNVYLNAPDGRYLMFGCLFEGDRLQAPGKRGWAGMQSLPREVGLSDDGLPLQRPAAECRQLRTKTLCFLEECCGGKLEAASEAFELFLRVDAGNAHNGNGEPIRILLLASPDNREYTRLDLDFSNQKVFLDRSHSTLTDKITREPIEAPLGIGKKEQVIDVFVDHSAIEIFINGEQTISARIFPSLTESRHNRVTIPYEIQVREAAFYAIEL